MIGRQAPTGTTATTPRSPLTDIRTIGPIVLVLFGLVLTFTPMASFGADESVGLIADQRPVCIHPDVIHEPPHSFSYEQALAHYEACRCPTNMGNAAFVGPDDWPCPQSTTPAPTSTTATLPTTTATPVTTPTSTEPPVTEPPATEPPVTEPPATEPPATEPPVTEPAPTATPAPTSAPDDEDALATPPAAAPVTGQLPATGSGGPSGTAMLGLLLAGLGATLLITGRRRTTTS